jgi:hypothetical protein
MKTIINNKVHLIALALMLGGILYLSSCEEEDVTDDDVRLSSFGPAGVQHGDEITFFGQNLDQVTAIVFTPSVEVPSSAFSSATSDRIYITVPDAAEAGKVILKTPQGDIESLTILNFNVPVKITNITGEVRPGATLTITGDKLNWIESITFPSDLTLSKEDFESQSLTQLVVTVPMDAQTGFLLFATGGTKPLTFGSAEQVVVTLPAVTALTPAPIRHTAELTITGTNLDLVTAIKFGGDAEVARDKFASQSATEIKLAVPATTVKGKLTLKQLSPVEVQTSDELVIALPVGTLAEPSPAKPGIDDLTITGTDLDLVAELGLPVIGTVQSASFKSQSATQIVIAVPEGTKSGGLTYKTVHGFSGNLGVTVRVPAPGPPPLPITLYDETIATGGGDYSWSQVVSDRASTEQFYSGDVSWKFETTASGGLSAGGITAVDASSQQVFAFALYGGPGTDGRQVAAILNDNWGNYNSVTLEEGKWTEYQIPLTSYPAINLNAVVRFAFKVEGISSSVIYADRVGFGAAGPAPLDYYLFDDAVQNSWQQWDGWGLTSKDFANEEQTFKGTKAIKAVYNDQYGAIQIGRGAAFDMTGYTTLTFRVYASAAQQFIVQLNDGADNYLDIPQGWSEVSLPIATMNGNTSAVSELRLKNNNAGLPVTLYYDEIGLRN